MAFFISSYLRNLNNELSIMKIVKKQSKNIFIKSLFILCVIASLFSQLPYCLAIGIDGWLKIVWILPLFYLFITHSVTFVSRDIVPFYLYVLTFTVYALFCNLITPSDVHYFGKDVANIWISLMVFSISYVFFKHYGTSDFISILSYFILIVAVIIGVLIYLDFFQGTSIKERMYVFSQKNSMSIILLSVIFISLFYFPQNKISKLFYTGGLIFLLSLIFIMKARAAILCFIVAVVLLVLRTNNKELKKGIIAAILLVIVFFIFHGEILDAIFNYIFLNSSNLNDFNDISSGRLNYISEALKKIPGHELIGNGDYYVDCMPINILVEYGLLGLGLIIAYLIMIGRRIARLNKNIPLYACVSILFVIFVVNSCFEANPPFGPGIKCFLLWTFLGFSMVRPHDHAK